MSVALSPRALVVHAHPEPQSFSSAQATTAVQALSDAGYDIDLLDLWKEGWAPVLDRTEFPGAATPFKPQSEQMSAVKGGTLDPTVKAHLERVLAADLLVLSFPMWWFSMPAILKGWIDRVFVMGAVFGGDYGLFDQAALNGRRAVLLVTTGGSEKAFTQDGAFGPMDSFLFHIHRGMLEFVGYHALSPVITYAPAHLGEHERLAALDAVRSSFRLIASNAAPLSH